MPKLSEIEIEQSNREQVRSLIARCSDIVTTVVYSLKKRNSEGAVEILLDAHSDQNKQPFYSRR